MAANGFDRLFEHPPTLEGVGVRMEPFAERHRDGLWTALGDPAVWRWVKIDASAGREVFDAWFDEAIAATAARTELGFVTLAQEDDRPVGSSRFLALRPADRGLEIKTDERNDRARAALAALPSTFEGIFRKHMLMFGGRWRDSAWYSITDEEWPRVRELLSERLAAQLTAA
jgi:hypothetical protein